MPSYDSGFKPPAPIALVSINSFDSPARVSNVPMLMDTGADASVVPLSVVNQLGGTFIPDRVLELESFDGTKSVVQLAHLELDFCDQLIRGPYILLDQPVGIIGRDVLNRINLNFDGPKLMWQSLA